MGLKKIAYRDKYFKPHFIKENKANQLPRFIMALDTEAYQEKIGDAHVQKLRMGWVIFKDLEEQTEHKHFFTNIEEFYDIIKRYLSNKRKIYVYAHNMDYDAQILDMLNISKYINGELVSLVIDDKNYILNFKAYLSEDGKKYCRLIFLSTTNYFKVKLKELGKMLGLPKLDTDPFDEDDEKVKEYCLRDTEIVMKIMEFYFNFIKKYDLGNYKYTIASQSFTAFKHKYMKHKIFIHNNPIALELEERSYRGGRTEAFRLGELPDNQYYYKLDINSMYPSVMLNNYYPTRLIRIIKEPSLNYLKDLMRKYLVIGDMDIELYENVIGIKRNRLIFPIGKISDVFTSPEIEIIMKYGKIEKIRNVAIYEKGKIFHNFVNDFYNLRLKYKQKGNEIMTYFIKLILNSLYGKFGQKTEKWEFEQDNPNHPNGLMDIYDMDNKKTISLLWVDGKEYKKKGYRLSQNSNVAIASFVTAYARCYITTLYLIAGKENVIYMDTDSLFTTKEGMERLKEHIDNKKLGMLKVESMTNNLIINNVKDYIWDKDIKLKGIRKNDIRLSNTLYKIKQFNHTKTNLRKYNLKGVIITNKIKRIKRVYLKGIVDKNNNIHPFKLLEW